MARVDDHLRQWRHNRAFLKRVPPDFPDWLVVAAFYAALHAVDALLAHDGVTVTNHEGRNLALVRNNRCDRIRRAYQPFYALPRTVRYLADPRQWVGWADLDALVVKRHLYPVEQSVEKLIGRDLQRGDVRLTEAPTPDPQT